MDINALLDDNGETEAVRTALINCKSVLQETARDYAEGALGAANETLRAVAEAAPCGAVWPHMYEFNQLFAKAQTAAQVAQQATGLLLTAEQTTDPQIDNMNRDAKFRSMELHVVAAMLEGAQNRMQIALQGIPNNGVPGERCNPKAILAAPPEEHDV